MLQLADERFIRTARTVDETRPGENRRGINSDSIAQTNARSTCARQISLGCAYSTQTTGKFRSRLTSSFSVEIGFSGTHCFFKFFLAFVCMLIICVFVFTFFYATKMYLLASVPANLTSLICCILCSTLMIVCKKMNNQQHVLQTLYFTSTCSTAEKL